MTFLRLRRSFLWFFFSRQGASARRRYRFERIESCEQFAEHSFCVDTCRGQFRLIHDAISVISWTLNFLLVSKPTEVSLSFARNSEPARRIPREGSGPVEMRPRAA